MDERLPSRTAKKPRAPPRWVGSAAMVRSVSAAAPTGSVDDRRVLVGDGGDLGGHGEDDVDVVDGAQVRLASVDPRRAGERLARVAVPIAAGVIPDAPKAAAVALLDMPAQAAVRHCSIAVITRRWAVESVSPA